MSIPESPCVDAGDQEIIRLELPSFIGLGMEDALPLLFFQFWGLKLVCFPISTFQSVPLIALFLWFIVVIRRNIE